jgi:hypothetical protein
MDPHTRAIPDFVLTISSAIRASMAGIQMGPNKPPFTSPSPSPTIYPPPTTYTRASSALSASFDQTLQLGHVPAPSTNQFNISSNEPASRVPGITSAKQPVTPATQSSRIQPHQISTCISPKFSLLQPPMPSSTCPVVSRPTAVPRMFSPFCSSRNSF